MNSVGGVLRGRNGGSFNQLSPADGFTTCPTCTRRIEIVRGRVRRHRLYRPAGSYGSFPRVCTGSDAQVPR